MIDSTCWSKLISKERKPSKCSKTSKVLQTAIGESLRYTEGLYKMMIEGMLAHGSSAWYLNPTYKMKRKLSSIHRPFLLNISGAYLTTPTAAL
ncbi:hypothetical protein AVEN_168637-1 [Araneus ventricosus]|uniref:Uncharacterized protein n=1 Tax=Araneus ventricosus TaxID=182803 RepID=A0A4Y2JD98_ARAVE|nr:hypothetical protein AVEN_168637-1 [Araneus ventricosus]